MSAASLVTAFVTGTIFASFIALAWTGPTSAPPSGNVAAPLNVGTTDQIKSAGLGLDALAVFGNSILSGPSVTYLNFGTLPGETGYGIRDNAGMMEFRDDGGNWSGFLSNTGVQSITFADGTTQTTAAVAGGVTEQTLVSCTASRFSTGPVSCTTPVCSAGYIRSGCSAARTSGYVTILEAFPSDTAACTCMFQMGSGATGGLISSGGTGTCYTHCVQ